MCNKHRLGRLRGRSGIPWTMYGYVHDLDIRIGRAWSGPQAIEDDLT